MHYRLHQSSPYEAPEYIENVKFVSSLKNYALIYLDENVYACVRQQNIQRIGCIWNPIMLPIIVCTEQLTL